MPDYDDDLRLAHVLADAVESTLLGLFGSADLHVRRKEDGSFVSTADTRTEELIRAQLARTRPRDVVQGEEFDVTGHGSRRWVIDPVDGTDSFIRGVPVWATLIGLVDGDTPVMGLVAAPALGRRWWASLGGGAFTGRSLSRATPIHVSDTAVLDHASLAYNDRGAWRRRGLLEQFDGLCDDVWRARGHLDFWGPMLVAEGAADIAVDALADLHDLAALAPIVTEAGGLLTDVTGRPGPGGGSAVVSNGILHRDVLTRFLPGRDS